MSLQTITVSQEPAERIERLCNGPLEFLRGVVQRTPMNASLKFETCNAIDALREVLDMREEHQLEYVFARALMESCFAPGDGGERVYEFLIDRFRNFDRRRQELTLPSTDFPIVARAAQLDRFASLRRRRVILFRAIHLAEAIDCDGPWTKSEEKDALMTFLARVLTGCVR